MSVEATIPPVAASRQSAGEVSGFLPKAAPLQWTEHPLIDLDENFRRLSAAEFAALADAAGDEAAMEYFKARERRIADSIRDPYLHEFALPHWQDVEDMVRRKTVTFIPGGNNPGKSRWAASLCVRVLCRRWTWPGMMQADKVKVLMIAQDDGASKMFQQDKVYAQLPEKWRAWNDSAKKPAGFGKYINYSEKNGFTEATFVLPKPLKGQCWYKTVAQYTREPQSFEGPDYDLVIIDEGCPLGLFKSLTGRVAKRGGKIVYLLTCVNGYDQTMGAGLEGAKITRTLPMQWDWLQEVRSQKSEVRTGNSNPTIVFPELRLNEHQTELLKRLNCPAGHMPYQMQPLNPQHGVIFMWNTWNPFQPPGKWEPPQRAADLQSADPNPPADRMSAAPSQFWVSRPGQLPAMMDSCVGDAKWRVLVKMFGWIERVGQLAIGNFNPEVHVVSGDRQAALDQMVRDGKATVYMSDDPETQRSHFILWQATFPPCPAWPRGLKYVFDESPRANEGEWVNPNGDRGEGQYVYRSTGANWYKRYIRQREREWGICDQLAEEYGRNAALHPCVALRRGDPRGFATEESTATGTRSLFELYLEDHSKEHPDSYPMIFTPAKIRRASSLDIDILIDLFRYDEDKAQREGGVTAENTPMRLVSSRCENWIRAALNYTLTDLGKADEDNPHRDPIDSDRYLNSGETPYHDLKPQAAMSGGAWT